MGYPERKKQILKILDKRDSMEVQEIADALGISAVTIRRDLQQLADEELLIRTHGGAMKAPPRHPFTAYADKETQAVNKKKYIGKLAAALVKPGDTIFLDCGSTVFTMCAHLKDITPLRIITNSLPVAAAFMDTPGIQVNLAGGEIDSQRKAMHGSKAIEHINSYHADKAFIGTDGLSVKSGLTAFSEKEASISTAMAGSADQLFVLCDSSKIGRDSYQKFAPLSLLNALVTDKEITEKQVAELKEKGVKVVK
ncbi:DeoR/GlpR family DNA-binding transcription regulator [Chitinophaga sp. sic0106]|uniref:DeoR/GlpR family DNA-binding transcription regulator n=1 Tax=Chitinophaga sp. sic0106 TaxID=2854785 RepID=UPI001C488D78|nr:DeoR/GlpR family DNA-binding transcription regulator [Chitinophaga sp. sic0106]MBV7533104.1 DeoR/GlpR family DNA-binding transcription regulator [Chitinophaga sp. sic0106]